MATAISTESIADSSTSPTSIVVNAPWSKSTQTAGLANYKQPPIAHNPSGAELGESAPDSESSATRVEDTDFVDGRGGNDARFEFENTRPLSVTVVVLGDLSMDSAGDIAWSRGYRLRGVTVCGICIVERVQESAPQRRDHS